MVAVVAAQPSNILVTTSRSGFLRFCGLYFSTSLARPILMMMYGGGADPLKLPKRLMIHKPMKIDGRIQWFKERFRVVC